MFDATFARALNRSVGRPLVRAAGTCHAVDPIAMYQERAAARITTKMVRAANRWPSTPVRRLYND